MAEHLKKLVREVPDFPKRGINFYDITTLLKDPQGLEGVLEELTGRFQGHDPDLVVGIESRGFLFGPVLAQRLGAGFVPVRKPGKLPAETVAQEYELEYGTDRLEMHADAVSAGDRVLIVDDLIATGGTAEATGRLVRSRGGEVIGYGFVIELGSLDGRRRLAPDLVDSLLVY